LLGFLLWFAAAFAIGYSLRVFVRAESDWGRSGLAFLGAMLATLGILVFERGWRSLGRIELENLGYLLVVTFMFLFPSAIGVHLASLRKPGS
jgi:hypothetical protein